MVDKEADRSRLESMSLPEPVPTTVIAAKSLIEILEKITLNLENRRLSVELIGQYRVAQKELDRALGNVVSSFGDWDVARAFQGAGFRQSVTHSESVQNIPTDNIRYRRWRVD